MHYEDRRHKWWGWGPADRLYDMHDRPKFWPWIKNILHIDFDEPIFMPVDRARLQISPGRDCAGFVEALAGAVSADQIRRDDDDRLLHGFGRSYRDVLRLRSGHIGRLPDLVLYPASHAQVESIVDAARRFDVVLIPYGGGSNVAGCLEPKDTRDRVVASLDMRRMNRLLSIDTESMMATIEAGAYGPDIEAQLSKHGCALGHHPDSFEYSTLGGWLATRSAGTQSNIWGKIEHMLLGVKMVCPQGTITTRALPAESNGPDVDRLVVGSEGMFGIITEATMQVHRLPEFEDYRVLLFRRFEDGFAAAKMCCDQGCLPATLRLSDALETELIFSAKHPSKGLKKHLEGPLLAWLSRLGYTHPCACIIGFEGPGKQTRHLRAQAMGIMRRHGAFDLGASSGRSWKRTRYDVPYLRDYVMNFGVACDTCETATSWANVLPMYQSVRQRMNEAIHTANGYGGYVGCHLSHFYPSGVCLYFTFAARSRPQWDADQMLECYKTIKGSANDAISAAGGPVSHHHAVGYEHQANLEQDVPPVALEAIRAVKLQLDPQSLMNPGTYLPDPTVPRQQRLFFGSLPPKIVGEATTRS